MPSLTLIKVGGKIVEEASSLQRLLTDFAAISGHKLLVHGGGRSATRIAEQLGIESRMVADLVPPMEVGLVSRREGALPQVPYAFQQFLVFACSALPDSILR